MQVLELMIKIVGKELRLHMQYLGEALAHRKKALRAWFAFNRAKKLFIPETNLMGPEVSIHKAT